MEKSQDIIRSLKGFKMTILRFWLGLFFSMYIFTLCGQSIPKDSSLYDDKNPFEVRKIEAQYFDSNQIKKIRPNVNIQRTNIIYYIDSSNGNKLRISYVFKSKNNWVSFLTPFIKHYDLSDFLKPYIEGYDLNDTILHLEGESTQEIMIKGTVFYKQDSIYSFSNEALLICKLDSTPEQVFKMFYGCYKSDWGTDGIYTSLTTKDFSFEEGVFTFEKVYEASESSTPQQTISNPCHTTYVEPGKYKLISGRFKKL
jgi:hypothetical protein